MASQLPSAIRQSTARLSSAAKVPLRQTISASPVFQRRYLSAVTRGLALSQRRGTLAGSHSYKPQSQCKVNGQNQIRRFNDEPPSLREWGFEEINTALPSSSTSPTHKPVILIDVREPAELKGTGIIPSAISIPLASQPDAMYLTPDEFEDRFGFPKPQADFDGTLVFYCKAGVRARAAAQLAVQAGYNPEQIGVYEGSWLDWERNGGKVERWDGDDD
ncbi:uncharacterized protein N7477_003913 [Penicillium maclennaniae]|uniref:uncharacterized protein n=1 Tax=Penicillium maclennaniae TaxID=1343394 RepID=UPI002541212A|nr:uncharacterized protein N7477_003913 [Penicillium maclennaniae]KAJ5678280.1 hypothetical protein N7477_003913 [Penicillium maclennaniae]